MGSERNYLKNSKRLKTGHRQAESSLRHVLADRRVGTMQTNSLTEPGSHEAACQPSNVKMISCVFVCPMSLHTLSLVPERGKETQRQESGEIGALRSGAERKQPEEETREEGSHKQVIWPSKLLGVGCTVSTKTPGGHGEKGNEITWFPLFKNRKAHQFFDGSSALYHMAWDAEEALRWGWDTWGG